MKQTDTKHKFLRSALAIALTVLLCIGMNAAAFLIDTPALRQNAAKSLITYLYEGAAPEIAGGYQSARLDNFTAALIVKTAAYTGEQSLLEKALGGYRAELPYAEGEDGWAAFCTYLDGSETPDGGLSYSRYWHGYTLPLRILLCLMNASGISMLLYYVQTALVLLVFALCMKRCPAILPGLGTAFFLLMPAATGLCLQYMPVTLLALSGSLALLLWDARIDRIFGMPAFFLLLGVLTNYLDLLTFPLVALGFPLAVRMALRMGDPAADVKSIFTELFLCGVCFGAGYAGMWAFKWLLTGVCFGMERLLGIFSQAALRISSESGGETHSRMDAVLRNLAVITDKPAYLYVVLLALVSSTAVPVLRIVRAVKRGHGLRIDLRAGLFLLLALVPPAWYVVMANHSIDHTYFTYRNIAVTFLALYAAVSHIIPAPEENA